MPPGSNFSSKECCENCNNADRGSDAHDKVLVLVVGNTVKQRFRKMAAIERAPGNQVPGHDDPVHVEHPRKVQMVDLPLK